jgi:hypothetical protein
MRIVDNGNVGIGINNPQARLDVQGNVYVRESGALYVNTIAGYSTNVISLATSTNLSVPSGRITLGTENTTDGRLQIRGSGVADATTTYGVILDRGTKIAWTNTGNASTGEYIYSQQSAPFGVTIHSGGQAAISCPNTGDVFINYLFGTCFIGTTTVSTSHKLHVVGTTFSSGGFFESSDTRLKNIINKYESVNFGAIEYGWNDNRDNKTHWGYSAQDVLSYLPDAVKEHDDGYLSLDYKQAHTYKIAMLEKRIEELELQLKTKL